MHTNLLVLVSATIASSLVLVHLTSLSHVLSFVALQSLTLNHLLALQYIMRSEVYIEEALLEVFNETDLVKFQAKLCVDLQLSRLEHFDHVTDDELHLVGLSIPAIRRLRLAIADKKKKLKKSKGIFSTVGRKDGQNMTKIMLAADAIPDAVPSTSKDTSSIATCLIAKEEIFLAEKLGEGSFAIVKRALWKRADGVKIDVAVKILREPSAEIMEDLQQEVNNMQRLQHPNLIRLYGIVFSNPAMMVVEFCDGGALLNRLRAVDKPVLLVLTLLDYSLQIAKGMTYLESKHCVHRDLAARNVLLTDGDRVGFPKILLIEYAFKTIKICDFGLMRALNENERLYTMSAQKKIPFACINLCPPESLRYRQFSRASDVWAFGVTLWELFSYGEEPWMGYRGAEVLAKLEAGERLQRPKWCSLEIYDLMSTCWSSNANVRPKFSLLKGLLADTKFTVVECRENFAPDGDLDLELQTNDRIVVIEGNGVIWYGQNIRTRKFGHFRRSAIHLRNERNSVSSPLITEPPLEKEIKNERIERISKPIPGSFIHAGHGDIVPSQCWGQPDRIDDIYLKNPILRKDWEMKRGSKKIRSLGSEEQKRPKFIPSVVSMQGISGTSILKSPTPPTLPVEKSAPQRLNPSNINSVKKSADTTSIYSTSSVDPFAPFSEYYYDAFDEHDFDKSWVPSQQNTLSTKSLVTATSLVQKVLPTELSIPTYDSPPLEPIRTYEELSSTASKYGYNSRVVFTANDVVSCLVPAASNQSQLLSTQKAVRNESCEVQKVLLPSIGEKIKNTSITPKSSVADFEPSNKISSTLNSYLVDSKGNNASLSRHPVRLPPPTAFKKSYLQPTDDNTSNKSNPALMHKPSLTKPSQKNYTRAVDGDVTSQHTSVNYGVLSSPNIKQLAPALAQKTLQKGALKVPASMPCILESGSSPLSKKGSSASLGDTHKVSGPTQPKTTVLQNVFIIQFNFCTSLDLGSLGRAVFNASKYYATSSKEAHEKHSDISVNNQQVSSNQETTFAVNFPSSSTNAENKDLVQKSAAVSAKVNLATKSALNTRNMSSSIENPVVISSASNTPLFTNSGADPFEISSSIKNIANRGRYSEVFTSTEGTQLSLPGQKFLTTVPVSSAKSVKNSTVPAVSNPLLPSTSPLFLGAQQNNSSGPHGLNPSTSLPSSLTKNDFWTGLPNNGSMSSFTQLTASNIETPKYVGFQPRFSTMPISGTAYGYRPSTTNAFGQESLNQNSSQLFGTSVSYNSSGKNLLTQNFTPSYYWHPGQSSFSTILTPEVSSSVNAANRTALVYDANDSIIGLTLDIFEIVNSQLCCDCLLAVVNN
uniref:non-specific protein-tyrosine kinase n=1 Tax=Syphacia muris TaxID=451379 RepID=A0A158R452_9BILA